MSWGGNVSGASVTRRRRRVRRWVWVLALVAAALAVAASLLGAGPASAVAAVSHYDTTACAYDASANLSTARTTGAAVRGPPSGQEAAPRVSHVSLVRFGVATNTAGNAAASTVRVGPGAALENITGSEALRIQNAANRIGQPIPLVGSRASGTAGAYSDWDYVITGIRASTRHSVSRSLPRGATELGVGRQIDVFRGPLDDALPHLTFFPSGG